MGWSPDRPLEFPQGCGLCGARGVGHVEANSKFWLHELQSAVVKYITTAIGGGAGIYNALSKLHAHSSRGALEILEKMTDFAPDRTVRNRAARRRWHHFFDPVKGWLC